MLSLVQQNADLPLSDQLQIGDAIIAEDSTDRYLILLVGSKSDVSHHRATMVKT